MQDRTDLVLLLALAIGGFVFWRIYRRHELAASSPGTQAAASGSPASTGANPRGSPSGSSFVALAPLSVEPSRQWLVLKKGQ